MKTYSVLFAEDVPHYGVAEIKAKDDAAALELAKAYDLSQVTNDGQWGNSACKRIVNIEDSEGNIVIEDIALDDCFLRYGGEKERVLCDAAPQLLKALEMCERAILEATDIMHYEDGLPVTALDGWEIERAYSALSSALVEAHQALTTLRRESP
jgi:hypothetical protein